MSKSGGSVEWRGGRWRARVGLADGSRSWVPLPEELTAGDEARARTLAVELAEQVKSVGAVRAKPVKSTALQKPTRSPTTTTTPSTETVEVWLNRWLDARNKRGLSSVETDRARLRTHVFPVIGERSITEVARDDLEELVESLDQRVLDGEMAWKTAWNAWALLSRAFKDACAAKDRSLRVRSDNPCAGIVGPDRGVRRAKGYLYPSEFLKLMECAAIPVEWRRCVAVTVYLYLRAGETEALEWEDIDLAHGTVHIHRAVDRDRGVVKETKGNTPRRFAIEPALRELLRAMHDASGGVGRVFDPWPLVKAQAEQLRGYLREAGVDRAELFADDATRKNMTFHDLRATGVTWMAVRGDEPLKIKHRAGHQTFSTTEGYIREAEAVREGFGEPFPPLPEGLLRGTGFCPPVVPELSPVGTEGGANLSKSHEGEGFGDRDSNPDSRNQNPASCR